MDPEELKAAIESIQKGFADMKTENEKRLVAVEKGQSTAEMDEKIAKLEGQIVSAESVKETNERLAKIETAIKRGGFGQSKEGDDEAKAESEELSGLVQKFMRRGSENMTEKEISRARELEKKTLSVDSDPDGGFYVSPDETGRLVQRIFETSPMRQVASVQQITSDALDGFADTDEAGAEWVGEKIAPTNTDTPQTGKWSIPVHEMATQPKATNKLLEDANINIEQWLSGHVSRKFARFENTAFVNGNGVAKPRGFLDYDAAADSEVFDREKIGRIVSTNNGALVFEDFIRLQTALKMAYAVNSTWSLNRRTKGEIRLLKSVDGIFLWQPSLQVGTPETLLGRPLVMFDDMPNIANGTLSVALSDWKEAYQIVDRTGISVLRDPFTNKPFVVFYTRKRVGGDVINTDAIKILETNQP